ncbi:hypothetical protein P171DRAFT_431900 [Karstenula rhodostoma CBS 690.94]|uniref:Uncharacterized protein n=1 Tax=Karstenula rhodostoma CBS 690.94 TaxID=1392251 RepID=A0A9P4PJI4_9PLEO|nr:hypothetical protein P171DRAFT_431900 [Karstenula rhodostoma CBS 690.94]
MTATKETPDVHAIKALIQSFFDRINASDAKGLATLFLPHANLSILRQDPARDPASDSPWSSVLLPHNAVPTTPHNADDEEKVTVVLRTSIEKFVPMIEDGEKRRKGKPGPKVHETPDLDATDVKVDYLFGTAWSPFRVTFDGELHHYGTFSFTFGKVDDGEGKVWRVEGLTQNYRRATGWGEGNELAKGSL